MRLIQEIINRKKYGKIQQHLKNEATNIKDHWHFIQAYNWSKIYLLANKIKTPNIKKINQKIEHEINKKIFNKPNKLNQTTNQAYTIITQAIEHYQKNQPKQNITTKKLYKTKGVILVSEYMLQEK